MVIEFVFEMCVRIRFLSFVVENSIYFGIWYEFSFHQLFPLEDIKSW